jgi:hypothetical protein
MDMKHVYEHISIDGFADYQIKVKGDIQNLQKFLDIYQTIQVTSESSDPEHQICMISLSNANQQKLFAFVNMLVRFEYPVISVICSGVRVKKTKQQSNYTSSSATQRR